jgi:UTP:GlnB (protein PII) uridylyltransferase
MSASIRATQVWVGDIRNRPGMLARLLEALSNAGAALEFMVVRRVTENTARVFLAPLSGKAQKAAAGDAGLTPAAGLHALRVGAPDRPGLGAELARAVADAGLNIRGASAAALKKTCVLYFAFKTDPEAKLAARVLKKALAPGRKR